MLDLERKAKRQGYKLVIGIDEAGRGPLAGPVVAAAVIVRRAGFKSRIADSKTLTPLQREKAFIEILRRSYVGVGVISEAVIDEVNILQASFLAMHNAVSHLMAALDPDRYPVHDRPAITHLLIDGNIFRTDLPFSYQTVIDGDAKCFSIACASIVAKVIRDRMLNAYDKIYPEYGFCRHKGYSTPEHRQAILRHGLSVIHRRSFSVPGFPLGV